MILEGIFNLIFGITKLVIGLLPKIGSLPFVGVSNLRKVLGYALWFFPAELWIVCIANISFWITVQFSWSLIEWCYKKLPGVD